MNCRRGHSYRYKLFLQASAGLFFIALLSFLALVPVRATGKVVINELMWDGTEYIELFNISDDEISLSGWTLTRQQKDGAEKIIVTFTDEDRIAANDYFLIERKEEATAIEANKVASGLVLVNTGELVRLKDEAGTVIDAANRTDTWLAGKDTVEGEAMERSDTASDGTQVDSWHTSTGNIGERVGTPGQTNTTAPVNHAPLAVISADGDEVGVNQVVTFSAEDSSDPDGDELTYAWDFGDGISGNDSVVTHAFTNSGSKIIQVAVSDGIARSTASLTLSVLAIAYSNDLIVNEFLPDPTGSDTDNEFIEVFNGGSGLINIGGWQLDDAEGGSAPYIIPSGTNLSAGGYMSFTRAVTKLALNNDGDSVRFLSPDGSLKASANYSDSTEGQSWNRVESGKYEESTTLTAGAKNVITHAVNQTEEEDEEEDDQGDFSHEIVVNELLPNPIGSDTENEFIELLNVGSTSINLTGWKLDDEDGGSTPYTIPSGTTLGAGKLLALLRPQTKLALNNEADSVRLFDPAGKEISNFTYEESVDEGIAWARDSQGKYQLTATLTQGKANIITPPTGGKTGSVAGASVKNIALKDVRSEKEGTMITTEGVVSASPGVLGKGILYVAGSGVQVYLSEEDYPAIAIGDRLKVTGELSSYLGESRIKLAAVTDLNVMGKVEAPLPHQIKTGEIGESLEGFLVMVVGRVMETSGDTFYVDDGSGAVKVFIKESTGIDKPKMKKGGLVTITGIVSQTTSGYRILPRLQEDVRLGAVAGLRTFPGTGFEEENQRQRVELLVIILSCVAVFYGLWQWQEGLRMLLD